MSTHPDNFASFYSNKILQIDYQLATYCYNVSKPFFKGKNCLELGPASGYMTRFLVNDFERVVAVEGAADLVDRIADAPNLEKVCSLFQDFKTEEKFDTIILNHVLEHIADPIPLLKQILQWLAPGGKFIVGVPNAKSFHRMVAVKMGLLESIYSLNERDLQLGHERVYDMDLLKAHLTDAGFTISHETGVFLKFLANGQIEKWFTQEMIQAFYELGKDFPELCAEILVIATNE
jgi:2-polyprenyl-3-methyl-5-hydroxy-6-metoxy-1,4-benzoquinol methylase